MAAERQGAGPLASDGHVGETELAAVAGIAIASSIFLGYPQTLVGHGATAAWLIPVISLLPVALGWLAISRLLRVFPGRSLPEVYMLVLGRWAGAAAHLLWVVLWWLLLGTSLREFADTVTTAVLPRTPVSVVALMFSAASAYAAWRGLEALSRAAWLMLPWLLGPTLLLLLATFTWWNTANFAPYLGTGTGPVVYWGLVKAGNFGELALLGTVAPLLRRADRIGRVGLRALTGAAAVTVFMVVVYQLAWPVLSAVRSPFPFIKLARLAFLGRFVQRVEALFVAVWVVVGVLFGAFAFHVLSLSLAQLLRMPSYRPLLLPQGVIVFALSFLLSQLIAARNFDAEALRHVLTLFTVVLPLGVWLLSRWRGHDRAGA